MVGDFIICLLAFLNIYIYLFFFFLIRKKEGSRKRSRRGSKRGPKAGSRWEGPGGGGGALGYFLGGYVLPGTPNWHPVLKKDSPKIDTPF